MTDRGFSNPNFGREVRVEVCGREVKLTFVAGTPPMANDLAEHIVGQLKNGAVNLTRRGQSDFDG